MNIYEYIKDDHFKIKKILSSLQNNLYDKKLFFKLAKEIILHSEAEEKVFYLPLQRKSIELKILIGNSWEEHNQIFHILTRLNKMRIEDEGWEELISSMIKSLKLHIDKEETELFSLAKLNLTNDEAQSMVNEMKSKKHSLENKIGKILNGNLLSDLFHKVLDKVIESKDAFTQSISHLVDKEETIKNTAKKAIKSSARIINNSLSLAASKMRTGTQEERKEAAKLLGSKGGKRSHGGGRHAKNMEDNEN